MYFREVCSIKWFLYKSITSHVMPRSNVKVNNIVDAPDILSTWTVCKIMDVKTCLTLSNNSSRRRITFGCPCNSTVLAFISTMPESKCPSTRAFWMRRSRMLTNNSNSLYPHQIYTIITAHKDVVFPTWPVTTNLFWISGGRPKRRLRKRPTSCISESTIRPEIFVPSFPLP